MAFRFRRRLRIVRGVYLNLSKGGVSTSIGRRGATVNISSNGTRATLGVPGTGLSYTTRRQPLTGGSSSSAPYRAPAPAEAPPGPLKTIFCFLLGVAIFALAVHLVLPLFTP